MTVLAFLFGGVLGAFAGALGVALAAAADRRPTTEPGRVHLYHPDLADFPGKRPGTRAAYRIHAVYPGQVLSVRGSLVGAPPNEPLGHYDPFGV